jgi:hypothetical protein
MPASARCALARANHVFGTDEKRIRTKYMVMDKSNHGSGLLSSAHHRASVTTGRLSEPLRQFLTGIKAAACVCAYISPH